MRTCRIAYLSLISFVLAALLAAPAPARAWKVDTHVYAANLVLGEALSTLTYGQETITDAALKDKIKLELRHIFGSNYGGRSRIDYLDNAMVQYVYYPPQDRLVCLHPVMAVQIPPFGWLKVDEDMARALFYFPGLFRAGAVGPDLFPDLITGQTVVHPGQGPKSGRWAAFLESEIRRIAGLYQGEEGDFDDSPTLRAYYAGWLAHMAGDLFGHSWVNDYAGGVWPEISDGITDAEKNNILRHLIIEAYVSKRIPAADLTGDRIAMDVPAGGHLTHRYLMTWMTGNGGRIDHDDSEDDRFEPNSMISSYTAGLPYHLDVIFSIRNRLRSDTQNINWDALWAGFITQLLFGYFDFGQASLLYNHQWFMDVDTALRELVHSQLRTARRMSAGEGFDAWFEEFETWLMNYGLSGLGLPDAVGRGIEMTSAVQEQIANAILPDEIKRIFSDLKRQFLDYVVNEAFGFTVTEVENALRDPATQFHNPALFPAGTKDKIDREIGNFGQAGPIEINFQPFMNTVNMIKLQLIEPGELFRIMHAEGAFDFTLAGVQGDEARVRLYFRKARALLMAFLAAEVNPVFAMAAELTGNDEDKFIHLARDRGHLGHIAARFLPYYQNRYPLPSPDETTLLGMLHVQSNFEPGIRMQFMQSLDAGYDWDRPDFAGCLLWDNQAARQKVFQRIFRIIQPGAGLAPSLSVAGPKFELSFPESNFRPRFVWQTAVPAAGFGAVATGGTVEIPLPPTGGTVDASGQLPGTKKVRFEDLSIATVPDFGVVLAPRPFGQVLSVPDGVHVHPATLAFAEAPPPPPVVLRFFAESKKYVSDGKMRDASSAPKLAEDGILVPLDIVAKELGVALHFDAAQGVATLETPEAKIELRAGSNDITVSGQKKALVPGTKAVPMAVELTLLVPLGFFEEHFGCRVVPLEKEKAAIVERRKFSDDAPSTVTGQPATAEKAAPAAEAGSAASPWSGQWITTIGDMDIVVAADNSVNFNYDGEFGRLEGKVDGIRLSGRFVEDNGARGEISLTLGRENRTFTGQWRRTDIADDYWHGCEGWRPFEEEPAAVPAGSAGSAEASASPWAGEWDTSIGDMIIFVAADGAARGGYDGTFGRLEGRAEGGRLTGRFYEDNGNWGEFLFVLEPGNEAFKGQWRRLNVDADDWHACEGTKVKK